MVMVRLLDGLVMLTSALVVVVALILDAVALGGLVARRGVFGVRGHRPSSAASGCRRF